MIWRSEFEPSTFSPILGQEVQGRQLPTRENVFPHLGSKKFDGRSLGGKGGGWWWKARKRNNCCPSGENHVQHYQYLSNMFKQLICQKNIMYSVLFMANNTWRQHVHVTNWILQTSCWLALFPVYPMFVLFYGTFAIPKVQPQAGEQVAKTGATVDEIPHLVL